jgi:hypothetical protein
MNYRAHAADPVVFTKFASSVTGPAAVVELPSDYPAVLAGQVVPRLLRLVTHAEVSGEMTTRFTAV